MCREKRGGENINTKWTRNRVFFKNSLNYQLRLTQKNLLKQFKKRQVFRGVKNFERKIFHVEIWKKSEERIFLMKMVRYKVYYAAYHEFCTPRSFRWDQKWKGRENRGGMGFVRLTRYGGLRYTGYAYVTTTIPGEKLSAKCQEGNIYTHIYHHWNKKRDCLFISSKGDASGIMLRGKKSCN